MVTGRGSPDRDAVHHHDRLLAGVALGEPGVRGVVDGDTDTAGIREFPGELGTGAEFPPRAEIGAAAMLEIAACRSRGQHDVRGEVDVDAKAAIAIERAVARPGYADERRDHPEHIAETVFAAKFGRSMAIWMRAARRYVECADAQRNMRRLA